MAAREHGGGVHCVNKFRGVLVEGLEARTLLAGPQVTFVEFDGPATPYTSKSHLVVRFNSNVGGSFGPTDIVLKHLDEGYEITNNSGFGNAFNVAYNTVTNTAVITFPGLIGEQLSDGNYQLRLIASGITDTTNQRLDGNKDGIPGDDFTSTFYRLTGDTQVDFYGTAKPDRKVDFTDYQILARNFGKSNATPREGDLNYDGVVDSVDMDILKGLPFDPLFPGVYGATLPPPPASTASVTAPAPAPIVAASSAVRRATPVTRPVTKPAPVAVAPARFASKAIKQSTSWLASA